MDTCYQVLLTTELVIDEGGVAGDIMESINKTVCPHTHSRVK